MALIDHVNWNGLDRLVNRQQRNRSAYAPAISLYRWWARRPHCFAGAVLDAAKREFRRELFLVADPFSGGGTVAFEASRRGLPVYAQDLYPWPSRSLATALTPAEPEEFKAAAGMVLEALSELRHSYWRRRGANTWETTHVIRVRSVVCPDCSKRFFLFRDPLISLASRRAKESHAFFGCSACGAVSRRQKDVRSFSCDRCKTRGSTAARSASFGTPEVHCPHCFKCLLLSQLLLSTFNWHPVLLREQLISERESLARLRVVEKGDPIEDVRTSQKHPLHAEIPDGLETAALTRCGFSFWDELYTRRQLDTITAALGTIPKLKVAEALEEHLRLAILGATEMAGYVCRWERYNPKALEAIANHRFSRSTVTVETNLLSTSGRGTLPRRFEATERALRWMRAEGYPVQTIHATSSADRRVVNGALVVTGSSERQLLQDGAAQLVFTDPPYHDDVQYGELARLFHAWMAHAAQCEKPIESEEAVPNAFRGVTTKHYAEKVAACLAESRRTLASNGRLVLTFHNKDLNAWEALAKALLCAEFDIVGLATVGAENSADHSKRGKQSFLSDLVIECRPRRKQKRRSWRLGIHGVTNRPERKNLEAIGLALAERVNRADGNLEALFNGHMKRLKVKQRLIRRGGK